MRRVLIVLALALAAALAIGGGVLALVAHRVLGPSMAPTLADGDLVAANPFDQRPDRFDVVLLRPSSGAQLMVKRIIGLPGDRIQIDTGVGGPRIRLSPAGSSGWYEMRLPGSTPAWRIGIDCCTPDGRSSRRPAPATVPAGKYFVLGDNPDESIDSRALGWIAPDAVRGVVAGRAWPPAALPAPPTLVAAR